MFDDDTPGLEVGFAINTGFSTDALLQLQKFMESTEYKTVQMAKNIERQTAGMVNLGPAIAQVETFGAAHTREMNNVIRDRNRAEKSGERMLAQLTRQAEEFGKTSSELRQYRSELRAVAADATGLTDLGDKIRAASARMDELERSSGRVGPSANGAKFAMQNLGYQAQDFVVQWQGGTSALRAFAMQAPQAAGALTGLGGKLGQVGGFLATGWGTAVLLAITLGAGFADSMLKGADAAETKKKAVDELKTAIDSLHDSTMRQVQSEEAFQAATIDSARALYSKAAAAAQTAQADLQRRIRANATVLAVTNGGSGEAAELGAYEAARQERLLKEQRLLTAAADAEAARAREAIKGAELVQVNTSIKASLDKTESARQRNRLASDALANAYIKETITLSEYTTKKTALDTATEKEITGLKKTREHVDRHAQSLARATHAGEVQVDNLFALADAYNASGGAALIAEAALKAQSAAIRQQADLKAATDRQIRAAIGQQLVDAARSTANMRDQADAQREVNKLVAAGLVPAEKAAELVQDRMEELPLIKALEAAQLRDAAAVGKVTEAIERLRGARATLRAETAATQFSADQASADNQIALLREELRLIGATDAARTEALDGLRAEQEAKAKGYKGSDLGDYVAKQKLITQYQREIAEARNAENGALSFQADTWDQIARNVERAGQGMADAFGSAGRAIGDMATIYAGFHADRERLDLEHQAAIVRAGARQDQVARENAKYALQTSTMQIGTYGDMAQAAKGFFGENTAGYEAMAAAEKAFRAVQFAMSVQAMAQDIRETAVSIGNSVARTAKNGVEAVSKALASVPPPLNFVAAGAVVAALAALGVSIAGGFGSGPKLAPSNTGTGTVLGDTSAKSESLKRAIDELKAVDTVTNVYSRQMLASLQSIDSQIGGVAAVIVRGGDINASAGVAQGFKPNLFGSVLGSIPLVGGILSGLFGTRTDVTGSGIYGGAQSVGSVLNGGFNAQAYSDVTKTKKFLGIVTGRSSSTEYGALDPALSNQFTLILRSFNDAIKAAAGPLGESTDAIQQRLNGFVLNIGKIDLKGLTGEQIQEKLSAVFGAAADNMATSAFPLVAQFQKVGEGAFETLTRVASTVEQVSTSLDLLGASAKGMGIAAKLGLADQFDSVSALNDAASAYFQAYYTSEEQAAAKTAQIAKAFTSLGVSTPGTLAAFRQLVEAQDLTTAAGQATYATLLKLAPAFADLQQSMQGAKSAADILSERQDLERQLLELQGKTDEIRKLDLAKLDASNRALQLQVWAIQDAQEAAKAADELRQAWSSVGDSIMDEVKRIRGLDGMAGQGGFASLMGQFNAATAAARGGDQDAAKSLPQLSQALLQAAAENATSRQELMRLQAQTAASLEATYGATQRLAAGQQVAANDAELLARAATAQQATGGGGSSDQRTDALAAKIDALTEELKQMRADNNAGHAATAGNTGKVAKVLDTATQAAGGVAIATKAVA